MNLIDVKVFGDALLVDIQDRGEKNINGIIIPDDDMKDRGLRPRQALVLAAGPDAIKAGIEPGDKVYIRQLEWSRKIGKYPSVDGTTEYGVWHTKAEKILLVEKAS